ncbi:MAG: hypothetical protein ACUVWN_15285 [bacterium]
MTINNANTQEIEKSREKFLPSNNKDVQGWIFSPQFLTILQVANIANAK